MPFFRAFRVPYCVFICGAYLHDCFTTFLQLLNVTHSQDDCESMLPSKCNKSFYFSSPYLPTKCAAGSLVVYQLLQTLNGKKMLLDRIRPPWLQGILSALHYVLFPTLFKTMLVPLICIKSR